MARLLSHLFVAADGPQFALVLAGGWALITERERWPEGRYLAVDLQLVGERADTTRGGEVDRALCCLARRFAGAGRRGRHLVVDGDRGVDQTHRRRLGGSARGRAAVHRDHRQRSGGPPRRRRLAAAATRAGAAAGPAGAAVPVPNPVPALRRSVPGAGGAAGRRPGYERGYSIDRLRELTLTELVTPRARNGTHLYESLAVLFGLVDRGHDGAGDDPGRRRGVDVPFAARRPVRCRRRPR